MSPPKFGERNLPDEFWERNKGLLVRGQERFQRVASRVLELSRKLDPERLVRITLTRRKLVNFEAVLPLDKGNVIDLGKRVC